MPHIKTYTQYEQVKDLAIYVILSPFDSKFYVGRGLKTSLRGRYKDHFNLRNAQTRDVFEVAKGQQQRPGMYLLESLQTAEAEAYRHIIAWVKYFSEHGYECLNHRKTVEYTLDLQDETAAIYERIKEISVTELLCEERHLFPNYGAKTLRSEGESQPDLEPEGHKISFRVTADEAEKIRERANKKGISVSQYARETLLDGASVDISFAFLGQYTKELQRQRGLIKQIIYTIHQTGNYTPSDLALVQELADQVSEHETKIRKELQKTMKQAFKKIAAANRR